MTREKEDDTMQIRTNTFKVHKAEFRDPVKKTELINAVIEHLGFLEKNDATRQHYPRNEIVDMLNSSFASANGNEFTIIFTPPPFSIHTIINN